MTFAFKVLFGVRIRLLLRMRLSQRQRVLRCLEKCFKKADELAINVRGKIFCRFGCRNSIGFNKR